MTQYRRNSTKEYSREFYRITETMLTIVQNKKGSSMISLNGNRFMFDEYRDSPESTESEFNEAYKYALDRITMQRLDI